MTAFAELDAQNPKSARIVYEPITKGVRDEATHALIDALLYLCLSAAPFFRAISGAA